MEIIRPLVTGSCFFVIAQRSPIVSYVAIMFPVIGAQMFGQLQPAQSLIRSSEFIVNHSEQGSRLPVSSSQLERSQAIFKCGSKLPLLIFESGQDPKHLS